jgi:hypothetical protein
VADPGEGIAGVFTAIVGGKIHDVNSDGVSDWKQVILIWGLGILVLYFLVFFCK